MIKRVFLFLLTNLAVIFVLSISIMVIERVFGINISAQGGSYTSILIFASIFGFGGAFISLAISRWSAKRAYGIKPITPEQAGMLTGKERLVYDVVSELAERNHIKMPEVGIYESNDPNAFATGASKNASLVAVSTGLLNIMTNDEIEGVVGHEMAHILNGDMVTMTLLQGIVNTFVIFVSRIIANLASSYFSKDGEGSTGIYYLVSIVLELVFGILASLIVMKFSRYREFRADEGSAKFVGKEKMIGGLKALQKMQSIASSDRGKFATMKISTKGKRGFRALFSSHPDLNDRITNLENLIIR